MELFENISHYFPEKEKSKVIKKIHASIDKKYSKEGKEKGLETEGKEA